MLFVSITAFVVAATFVSIALYLLKDMFIKKGYYGLDVHKPTNPKVAEMGGLVSSFFVIFVLSALWFYLKAPLKSLDFVFDLTFVYYTLFGLVDDLSPLNGKIKLFLSLFGGVFVELVAELFDIKFYSPRPFLPLIGQIHGIYTLYPFLIPIALAITSNAYNMYDVYNGTLSFASIANYLLIGTLVIFDLDSGYPAFFSFLAFLCAGVSLGLFIVNRYPSRFFLGDVGSLPLGAAFGMLAIMSHLEIVSAIAIMPMLMNGFLVFASAKKIFERHEIKQRPVIVENGLIRANPSKEAPMSLANILTSRKPLTEKQIIIRYHLLSIISIILAIFTFLLTPW